MTDGAIVENGKLGEKLSRLKF